MSDVKHVKLSVVIPVYNAEHYIRQTIDSVLGQSLSDLEVICVDDASADASVNIIKEYQKKDFRVKLIKNETNSYAGVCRNKGLAIAEGEYVHFLDADDLVEENAYEKFYMLASASKADFIKGRSKIFNNDTGEISTTGLLDFAKVPEEAFGRACTFFENPEIFSHIGVVPWNGIYRRAFLLEHGIEFNHLICVNDRSFYNETCIAADRILLTREFLVRYRTNNHQSLVGNRARNFGCQFVSYDIVKEQCRKYLIQGSLLKCILDRELVDLFVWYRRYSKVPEIQEKIKAQTKAFLQNLDKEPFQGGVPEVRWYYDYLMLLETHVLTVAVYLEGAPDLLEQCLDSIRNQSVDKMQVYGIPGKEAGAEVFAKYACEDKRFRETVSALEKVPRSAPYFFETYPKVFHKKNEFENQIKKAMKTMGIKESHEVLLYKPETEKKTGLLQRALHKGKRILKGLK